MSEPYYQPGRFVDVDGVSIHYALDGDAAAPTLALVNPASHNLTCWEVVLDGLLRDFQVLRFDIRGTGKSGWGRDDDFTFARYADDLAGLMDVLGIDRAFVLMSIFTEIRTYLTCIPVQSPYAQHHLVR